MVENYGDETNPMTEDQLNNARRHGETLISMPDDEPDTRGVEAADSYLDQFSQYREMREEVQRLRAALERELTFAALREANVTRCKRWHPNFLMGNDAGLSAVEEWSGADWSNAMCGEAGETANVVKKLRRLETGTDQGPDDPPPERLREMLADEIADTVTYADLLAAHYGIDLAAAIASKFNRVSERQGFPDRIAAAALDREGEG